jgi:deoxyribodipyrimidine photo-lyase
MSDDDAPDHGSADREGASPAHGPSIVWLRDDLRVADNPALHAAVERGEPIVVLYVLDEESDGIRPLGGAALWWLHMSLSRLGDSLRELGSPLVLRRGKAAEVLDDLVAEVGAGAVLWNRRYGGAEVAVDTAIKKDLGDRGLDVRSFQGSLLVEPWTVMNKQGEPFRVYSPFWRAAQEQAEPRTPFPAPDALDAPARALRSEDLDDWGLLPTEPDWAGGLRASCDPGEAAGLRRLEDFVHHELEDYAEDRDRPAALSTSRLSPYLRWGEVSPFQVWHRIQRTRGRKVGGDDANAAKFLSEIGWREFSYHLLYHHPDLATRNFTPRFDRFPWEEPTDATLGAWQRGMTGVPLVDAGMRALWRDGHLHNRVRMVVASFLIKNLLIDWRLGEQWFWDTLVDADAANNAASWQWVAGSGADAAPYFRVFNPVLQGQKFDPSGEYIRSYVPELAHAPRDVVHEPWKAQGDLVASAEDVADEQAAGGLAAYPSPIVDLKESRRRALAAYDVVKDL